MLGAGMGDGMGRPTPRPSDGQRDTARHHRISFHRKDDAPPQPELIFAAPVSASISIHYFLPETMVMVMMAWQRFSLSDTCEFRTSVEVLKYARNIHLQLTWSHAGDYNPNDSAAAS